MNTLFEKSVKNIWKGGGRLSQEAEDEYDHNIETEGHPDEFPPSSQLGFWRWSAIGCNHDYHRWMIMANSTLLSSSK